MAEVCGWKQRELVDLGIMEAIDVTAGTGATWLVSTATNPFVGGSLGGVAHVVSALAITVLTEFAFIKKHAVAFFLALELSMPVVLSFAATALGFPVSIPLALIIGAINAASFYGVAFLA